MEYPTDYEIKLSYAIQGESEQNRAFPYRAYIDLGVELSMLIAMRSQIYRILQQ